MGVCPHLDRRGVWHLPGGGGGAQNSPKRFPSNFSFGALTKILGKGFQPGTLPWTEFGHPDSATVEVGGVFPGQVLISNPVPCLQHVSNFEKKGQLSRVKFLHFSLFFEGFILHCCAFLYGRSGPRWCVVGPQGPAGASACLCGHSCTIGLVGSL